MITGSVSYLIVLPVQLIPYLLLTTIPGSSAGITVVKD